MSSRIFHVSRLFGSVNRNRSFSGMVFGILLSAIAIGSRKPTIHLLAYAIYAVPIARIACARLH